MARRRDDALRDFQLDHDVNRGDALGLLEQAMENGRRDVVRKIAVNAKARRREFVEVEIENVSFDYLDIRPIVGALAQTRCEQRIGFDGDHAAAVGGEEFGHFAVSRADFDPDVIVCVVVCDDERQCRVVSGAGGGSVAKMRLRQARSPRKCWPIFCRDMSEASVAMRQRCNNIVSQYAAGIILTEQHPSAKFLFLAKTHENPLCSLGRTTLLEDGRPGRRDRRAFASAREAGHEIAVLLPRYRGNKIGSVLVSSVTMAFGDPLGFPSIAEAKSVNGVRYFFVDDPEFFDREQLYGDKNGEYPDNAERFAEFSRAAIEFASASGCRT